jgi:hypothetical protein
MEPLVGTELRPYLERLHEVPFVVSAVLAPAGRTTSESDAGLSMRTTPDRRVFHLHVVHQRSRRLNEVLLGSILARPRTLPATAWILFAPHVTSAMATRLAQHGMNFVDLAGNCRLVLEPSHMAIIEGRRGARADEDARTVGPVGYWVMFTLLADASARALSVRDLARRSGVGKSATAIALVRLEQSNLIARARGGISILKPRAFFERWLIGHLEFARPHSVLGRFQSAETDPSRLEELIETELSANRPLPRVAESAPPFAGERGFRFAWGGARAAWRLVRHHRGEQAILYVNQLPPDFAVRLRLLPSRTGNLSILAVENEDCFRGEQPQTAHSLLVYADLLALGDDRAAEAAEILRARYLGECS